MIQAWLVPLADDLPSSGCAWHAGPAVHSGFRASWHSSLKNSVLSFITSTVCPDADQASTMRVRIAGTRCTLSDFIVQLATAAVTKELQSPEHITADFVIFAQEPYMLKCTC